MGDPKELITRAREQRKRLPMVVVGSMMERRVITDAANDLSELADALADAYRDYNHQVYLRDKDREASWKHEVELTRERDVEINSLRAALELHPDGRCVCHGEGECDFCRRCCAEIERDEARAELMEMKR